MINKNYLTTHPQIYKKVSTKKRQFNNETSFNIDQYAKKLIDKQLEKINQLELQIQAYQVQNQLQSKKKFDNKPILQQLQNQILDIRKQEASITSQIKNCQLVEGKVTPLQYYLWKKKQRINTYHKAVQDLCQQIQKQRQFLQDQTKNLKSQSQDLYKQIQQLEQKITYLNNTPYESQIIQKQAQQQLYSKNTQLKAQYQSLLSTNTMLQQNRDIYIMQIADGIGSYQTSIRQYFQTQKIRLARDFKQIHLDSRQIQISPLTTQQLNYKIQPLFQDYSFKMNQILMGVPEQIRKKAAKLLNPLPWQKFNWRDFVQIDKQSEKINNEYRSLQNECTQINEQSKKIKFQIEFVSQQLMIEQQKSNQISQNIRKMKKSIKK